MYTNEQRVYYIRTSKIRVQSTGNKMQFSKTIECFSSSFFDDYPHALQQISKDSQLMR